LNGPIVTEIRGLLTPPPSREMRVKSEYIHHKQVKGALGVKVIGNNLDKVMAGTPVMVRTITRWWSLLFECGILHGILLVLL